MLTKYEIELIKLDIRDKEFNDRLRMETIFVSYLEALDLIEKLQNEIAGSD